MQGPSDDSASAGPPGYARGYVREGRLSNEPALVDDVGFVDAVFYIEYPSRNRARNRGHSPAALRWRGFPNA